MNKIFCLLIAIGVTSVSWTHKKITLFIKYQNELKKVNIILPIENYKVVSDSTIEFKHRLSNEVKVSIIDYPCPQNVTISICDGCFYDIIDVAGVNDDSLLKKANITDAKVYQSGNVFVYNRNYRNICLMVTINKNGNMNLKDQLTYKWFVDLCNGIKIRHMKTELVN